MLYRRVLPVTRTSDGGLALDGAGEPVEWLLEMARFDQDLLLDRLAAGDALDPALMEALARVIADLHRDAEAKAVDGHAAMQKIVEGNAEDFRGLEDALDAGEQVGPLNQATRAELDRRQALLAARGREGFVRRCHGDLHLANIVLLDGQPVLFDCLEFDEELATTDLFYDLAFLLMDLCHRGLQDRAIDLLNGYLEATGDDRGTALLPLFLAVRATIRGKIEGFEIETSEEDEARRGHREAAKQYLDLASALLETAPPMLIAIGGLSGSGKSTIAKALARKLGTERWTVVLRSDVIRKQLHGKAPTEPLPAAAYRPEVSAEVHRVLAERAGLLLEAGRSVILDATFLDLDQRAQAEAVAAASGLPFQGLWLQAEEAVLEARIGARSDDASDATAVVLERQRARDPGAGSWTAIDAAGAPAAVAAAAFAALSPGG
jgi:aminoglycoside phosphotransferase family enzyme/predicted kinase